MISLPRHLLVAGALALAACGGGGGGGPSVSTPTDPTTPPPTQPTPAVDYSRTNPNATDLLDVWNDPASFIHALGLSPVPASEHDARRAQFRDMLAGQDPAGDTLTRLRNVDPADLDILGQYNGITYARWQGGPADGLNIDFYWKLAPDLTPSERAVFERAGKEWTYRLDDTLRTPRTISPGDPRLDHLPAPLQEALTAEDLTILMFSDPGARSTYASDLWTGDFPTSIRPWFGAIVVATDRFRTPEQDRPGSGQSREWVAAHEIGHLLGINEGLLTRQTTSQYVNHQDGTFTGPNAMRANGGNPVPFQRLQIMGDRRLPVPPDTPGAVTDYAHPGVCPTTMGYCLNQYPTTPTELDFAFLADMGLTVRPASVRDEPETYGYAAWGDWAAWGVGAARLLQGSQDQLYASADAFGIGPSATLAENTALTGAVTWTGALLGVDLASGADFAPVAGEAALTVDLSTLEGQAVFDNLQVGRRADPGVGTPVEAVPFRHTSLSYGITVAGNAFTDAAGHVQGGFFGPSHEEMAGTLDDRTPGVELLAGFGGKR